ncbi:helicase HerA domain-containing protein [Deinococcus hopiensis]|uniref:VirB4 family type IV secretion system protein n=1 Tax=Deinococcus hopiensis TaxID=309885 RepID=UPI000A04E248
MLPYWDIHNNIMVLKDGRLMYGFYFEPPTHIHFTSDNLQKRNSRLKAVFDLAVPDGETLTTYTSLRTAHEGDVADTRSHANSCPDPVIKELTHARAALLESKIARGEVSHWRFFATVTVTPPPEDRFSKDAPPSSTELDAAVNNALALQAATVAQMRASGFRAEAMTGQDVFTEAFFYLNPSWPEAPEFVPQGEREIYSMRRGVPDQQSLIRQLTTAAGNNLHSKHFIVGDRFVDVLSLSRLPEYTETGYLKEITDELHGTYYVVVQATRENDYDVSNELEKKKNDLWTRVKSPGVIPNGKAVNLLDQIELAQRLEGLESRFDAAVSVVLVAQTAQELETMKRKARGNMTRLRGGMPITYGFQANAQYLALLPFGGGRSGFEFKPYTNNVIDLFPPVSPWKGFEEGAITYQNRDKSLIRFDLFTKNTVTAHFCVFAPTGSGKTVLVQSLLNAELAKYPDAAVIVTDAKQDFGYFFRSIQDAEIITFGYGSDTRLNVFDLEEGADAPDGEKLASLMTFIRIFVEPPRDLRDKGYEDVAITEGIMAIYVQFKNEQRAPQMSDLYRMLTVIENYTDSGRQMEPRVIEAARSVAVRLRKALGASPVAPFVDCQSNKKLTARRIYLSLYGIPEDDELMKRISQHIIKNVVWTTAKNYPRGVKKFIFFDEFENQVQTDDELDAVKRMLRVFRSFGVSFGMGTQSATASQYFGDLRDSFSHLFIGRYSKDVAKDVVRVLSLPEVMAELLPTLNNVVGQYSEFALLVQQSGELNSNEKIGDIIQVQESKLALWVFNSGNQEVAEKDRYVAAANGNVIEGVRKLVTDKFGSHI